MYFLGVARAANVDKLSFLHALNRQTRRVFGIKQTLNTGILVMIYRMQF